MGFKSTDEGKTWTQIKLPPFEGRVAVAIAMLIVVVGPLMLMQSAQNRVVEGK